MGKPTAYQTKLSERERRFVELLMGEHVGNATAAYAAAYGKTNRNVAGQLGHRLLKKVKIRKAIDERIAGDPGGIVATREQRQLFCSELLGKSQGDFVEHHVLDVGESLYELLGGRPLPTAK